MGNQAMATKAPLRQQSVIGKIIIAWMLFSVMAVVKTYPLVLNMSNHIPGDLGDPLLNAWIMSWDYHSLTTDPWNLFDANILYPVEKSLALSEHLLGLLPIFAPAYALTGNPIFAYNTVFFLSFPLCGLAMFLLVYYWTGNFWASLLAGFLFAFAPVRLGQFSHLQLYNLFWAPLAFLFLDKFLRYTRWEDLTAFALLYWLQILSSVYLGWLTTTSVILYVLYYVVFLRRDLLARSLLPHFGFFSVASLFVLLPLHWPYIEVKRQWGMSRSLEECVFYAADPFFSYLTPPFVVNDLYWSLLRFAESRFAGNEKMLFPGIVAPILALLGGIVADKGLCGGEASRLKRLFTLILVASFLLSLGPFLTIADHNTHIPLPYYLLYQLAPGFQSMRVPARFALMVGLAASVLAALGFLWLWRVLQARFCLEGRWAATIEGVLALFILGLFTLELGFKPMPMARVQTGREVPEVYGWLATNPFSGAIVELPHGHWEDYQYTYFSTYHWLPIVNGTSGFTPSTYAALAKVLKELPTRQGVELLSSIGLKALVLHTDRLPPPTAALWKQADMVALGLEKVAVFGSDIIYKLPEAGPIPPPRAELILPEHLPVNERVTVGLLLDGIRLNAASSPRPVGRTPGLVTWTEQRSGRTFLQKKKVTLSLPYKAPGTLRPSLPVRTPSPPGLYSMKVTLPALGLETAPKLVELQSSLFQTSLSFPSLLSATYGFVEHPSEGVRVSMPLRIALKVWNTGQAVWLARADDDTGAVRLGWRWFQGEREVPATSGREPLQYDIFPGEPYLFEVSVNTPPLAGVYTLELGLLSEHVTWFFDQAVEPVKLSIRVQNEPEAAR
jgi:hypothetical protein